MAKMDAREREREREKKEKKRWFTCFHASKSFFPTQGRGHRVRVFPSDFDG